MRIFVVCVIFGLAVSASACAPLQEEDLAAVSTLTTELDTAAFAEPPTQPVTSPTPLATPSSNMDPKVEGTLVAALKTLNPDISPETQATLLAALATPRSTEDAYYREYIFTALGISTPDISDGISLFDPVRIDILNRLNPPEEPCWLEICEKYTDGLLSIKMWRYLDGVSSSRWSHSSMFDFEIRNQSESTIQIDFGTNNFQFFDGSGRESSCFDIFYNTILEPIKDNQPKEDSWDQAIIAEDVSYSLKKGEVFYFAVVCGFGEDTPTVKLEMQGLSKLPRISWVLENSTQHLR